MHIQQRDSTGFGAFRKMLWLYLLYVFSIVLSTICSFYRLFYLYTLPKCIELIMRWALHPNHHRKMQKKINEKRKSACFVRIIKYVLIANKYFTYSYSNIGRHSHCSICPYGVCTDNLCMLKLLFYVVHSFYQNIRQRLSTVLLAKLILYTNLR